MDCLVLALVGIVLALDTGANQVVESTLSTPWTKEQQGEEGRCLLHYAIAKTGSSSIRRWFKQQNGSTVCTARNPASNSCNVFSDHFGIGAAEHLASQDIAHGCYSFTVLRSPFERALSDLRYQQKQFGKSYDDNALIKLLSNPEALSDNQGDKYFDHMCRQLSGLTQTWDRWDARYAIDWSATCDVDRAKHFLKQMSFVGFMEGMDGVFAKLSHITGWQPPTASLVVNAGSHLKVRSDNVGKYTVGAKVVGLVKDKSQEGTVILVHSFDDSNSGRFQ
jgi:hypothetical protein